MSYRDTIGRIVDSMVSKKFKSKKPEVATKEKEEISKGISKALSRLNDVGKILVLRDLKVDPDKRFADYFDGKGNADILGITKFTAGIVKEKIEYAKVHLGIDLSRDANPVIVEYTIPQKAMAVAALHLMLKNYDKISDGDRRKILDHFDELSLAEKMEIVEGNIKILDKLKKRARTPEEKKSIDEDQKVVEAVKRLGKALDAKSEEEIRRIFEEYPGILEYYKKKSKENPELAKIVEKPLEDYSMPEILNLAENIFNVVAKDTSEKIDAMKTRADLEDKLENIDNSSPEYERTAEEFKKIVSKLKLDKDYYELLKPKEITSEERSKKAQETSEERIGEIDSSKDIHGKADTQESIISKFVREQEEKGYSSEEIVEAIQRYESFFRELDDEDKEGLSSIDDKEIKSILEETFEEYEVSDSVKNILKAMSGLKFEEPLQTILSDPQKTESFFAQIGTAVSEIGKTEIVKEDKSEMFEEAVHEEKASEEEQILESEKMETPPMEMEAEPEEVAEMSKEIIEKDASSFENENQALEVVDNSFFGKVKRFFANIRAERESGQSIIGGIRTSFQKVFGSKKEEAKAKPEEIDTTKIDTARIADETIAEEKISDFDASLKVAVKPIITKNPEKSSVVRAGEKLVIAAGQTNKQRTNDEAQK